MTSFKKKYRLLLENTLSIKQVQFACIIKENFRVASIQMNLKKTYYRDLHHC